MVFGSNWKLFKSLLVPLFMKKEKITILAQLLTAIKDAADKLEEAEKEKDAVKLASAKREILNFQKKISEML